MASPEQTPATGEEGAFCNFSATIPALAHFRLSFIRSPIARQSFTSSDERTRTLRISTADIGSGCHPRLRGPGSIAKRGPAESLVQLSVLRGFHWFWWGSDRFRFTALAGAVFLRRSSQYRSKRSTASNASGTAVSTSFPRPTNCTKISQAAFSVGSVYFSGIGPSGYEFEWC